MSLSNSVYIGPYYLLPQGFDWTPGADLLVDGRMEFGHEDADVVLVPNKALRNITRPKRFDQYDGNLGYHDITPVTIRLECLALDELCASFLKHCEENAVLVCKRWGTVHCCS